jgi:hypothetical protein
MSPWHVGPVWRTIAIAVRNGIPMRSQSRSHRQHFFFFFLKLTSLHRWHTVWYDDKLSHHRMTNGRSQASQRCGDIKVNVCTVGMNDLECPNPDHDYEQTHRHPLCTYAFPLKDCLTLYLKYMGLCVTRPNVTRWG